MGPRKEEEENNCGRTAEVIEHPIAAPELCLSTQWVRILTCGCTYLRVSIIVFIHYIQTEACTAHRLERLPLTFWGTHSQTESDSRVMTCV